MRALGLVEFVTPPPAFRRIYLSRIFSHRCSQKLDVAFSGVFFYFHCRPPRSAWEWSAERFRFVTVQTEAYLFYCFTPLAARLV